MKTYIFLYTDSNDSDRNMEFKYWETKQKRFAQALREFLSFLSKHPCLYIGYGSSYYVVSDTQKSWRLHSDKTLIRLAYIKDKHNVKYYEEFNDEIY